MSMDNRNIRDLKDIRYIKDNIYIKGLQRYQEISGIKRISMNIMYMGDFNDIKDVKGYKFILLISREIRDI